MNRPPTLHWDIHFHREGRGGPKEIRKGPKPKRSLVRPVRIARIARLMALALRYEELLRSGEVTTYAELAQRGRVSCARISQILNLLQLAPDIQEQLLFLYQRPHGRDPIHLARLQPIAAKLEWRKQRPRWRELLAVAGMANPEGEVLSEEDG